MTILQPNTAIIVEIRDLYCEHMSSKPQMVSNKADICRYHQPASLAYTDFFTLKEHEIIERESLQKMKTATSQCREFLMPGIHFMQFIYTDAQKDEIIFKSKEPYISMVFCEKSHCVYTNQQTGSVFADINYNEHSLIFIANQEVRIQWQCEQDTEIFIINLTIDYFKRFISDKHPLHQAFESCLNENIPSVLGERRLQVSPRMFTLLYDVAQCEQKDYYKRMFIKSKVIELLMLQFEQLENVANAPIPELSENIHLEKMYLARDIITSNISKPCSILDLAQQIGTNDCYLKRYFKKAFGTTVYGYLQKERMERSREMLLEGEKKISEIARLTGYKHASHFTTAFKKYFGYLPNKIRMLIIPLLSQPEVIAVFESPLFVAV